MINQYVSEPLPVIRVQGDNIRQSRCKSRYSSKSVCGILHNSQTREPPGTQDGPVGKVFRCTTPVCQHHDITLVEGRLLPGKV